MQFFVYGRLNFFLHFIHSIIYIQQILLYFTKDLTPNRLENKICNAILQIFKS